MDNLTPLFKALADPARLRILNLLFKSGELCVCDLESVLGFTQTKVSRHVGYLKRARLVEDRKVGRWVLYRIANPRSEEQRSVVESVREILQSHTQARRDSARLQKRVDDGCCATMVFAKPTTE